MAETRLAEFGQIDQTADAGYFIRFLDTACAEDSFQAYKQRLLDELDLGPCRSVLDIGCGTGDDARRMASLVGTRGRVVGIDNSQSMLEEARRRASEVKFPIEFLAAEATDLPFDRGSFHASVADRSLMHVPDAERVLAEMVRVTMSRIVVFEVDFETLTIDADDRGLARTICHTWCDGFRNGWLGRRVPRLLANLGVRILSVTPYTLRLPPALALPLLGSTTVERAIEQQSITREQGRHWLQQLDQLQQSGPFFSTLTGFLVVGQAH